MFRLSPQAFPSHCCAASSHIRLIGAFRRGVPLDFVDTLIEFISVCNGPSAITLATLVMMLTPPQLPSVHHNLSCDGCARTAEENRMGKESVLDKT